MFNIKTSIPQQNGKMKHKREFKNINTLKNLIKNSLCAKFKGKRGKLEQHLDIKII